MKSPTRILLSALGLAGAAASASAQHYEYITEAPVTFEITFGTHVRAADDETLTKFTTKPITSRLGNQDILKQLKADGVLPADADVTQWLLIAARAAPADRNVINGTFELYAVKADRSEKRYLGWGETGTNTFNAIDTTTIYNYSESHQGVNILASKGITTSYDSIYFTPKFTTPVRRSATTIQDGQRVYTETRETYELNILESSGFSSIAFEAPAVKPVFYLGLNSIRFSSLGDFTGVATQTVTTYRQPVSGSDPAQPDPEPVVTTTPTDVPSAGLVSLRLTVGTPRLVLQSDYPEVPYFDGIRYIFE